MPRNTRGGGKVTGLGQYGKSPPRKKKKLDGRCYEDAQPWHPDTPRVRVQQAFLVPRALFTALCALSGHAIPARGLCQRCPKPVALADTINW